MQELSETVQEHNHDGDIVLLSRFKLSEQALLDSVRHASAGALCCFVGTTRDYFQGMLHPSAFLNSRIRSSGVTFTGKTVTRLEYETYLSMALKTLHKIHNKLRQAAQDGTEPFDQPTTIQRSLIAHRLGLVPPTESSIVVIAATGHRRESFQACEWLLEQVKLHVPIWKKEVYASEGSGSAVGDDQQGRAVWKENFPPIAQQEQV